VFIYFSLLFLCVIICWRDLFDAQNGASGKLGKLIYSLSRLWATNNCCAIIVWVLGPAGALIMYLLYILCNSCYVVYYIFVIVILES
jgi:hypothetical protein